MRKQRINGKTLDEVVTDYLGELDNPAANYAMRQIYRDWMAEFVGAPTPVGAFARAKRRGRQESTATNSLTLLNDTQGA